MTTITVTRSVDPGRLGLSALLWVVATVQSMLTSLSDAMAVRRRSTAGTIAFNALWVPLAIVLLGAAAMTVWCTLRGYSGWEFRWKFPVGFRAACV